MHSSQVVQRLVSIQGSSPPFFLAGAAAGAAAAAGGGAVATAPAGGGFLGPQLPDGGARLLVTGEGGSPSLPSLMQRLRDDGVRHALVESPSLTAQLAALGMVDELWLTTSGLLLGGDRTIGAARALPLDRVPRGRLVGLHRVGDGFLFARWVLSSQS